MLATLLTNIFLSRFKLPRDVHRYAFKHYSSRILLQTENSIITYASLQDRAYRLVSAWQDMGLVKGDIVFVQVKADEELFEIRTAALELGVLLTSFHEAHPASFLVYAAGEAPPKLFIANPEYGQGSTDAMLSERPEIPVWKTGTSERYELEIDTHEPIDINTIISPLDPMGLGFTSGTTGKPKCLISTHGAAISSLKLMIRNIEKIPTKLEREINLTAIPLVGAGYGFIMPTIINGGTLLTLDEYSPEKLVNSINKFGVTSLFITPSQLIDLLEISTTDDQKLTTVKQVIYGTAPMPAAKLEEAIKRFGPIFQQGYGQAEVLPPVSILGSSEHMQNGHIAPRTVLTSSGRVVDGVEVRISGPTGQHLPRGSVGEVQVNTPTRFKSYLNPEQNKGVILEDGFFVTGDHGYLDTDGYLHILDRRADLISTHEGVIYPRLVEEEVHDYPAVRECCLVAVAGQPVLCVSIRNAYLDMDKSEIKTGILNLLDSRVSSWQMPVDIVFVEQMPRSLLGKVLRREVRDKLNTKLED